MSSTESSAPALPAVPAYDPTAKQKAEAKTARIPIKIVPAETLKKPDWIRIKLGAGRPSASTRSSRPARAQAAHRVRGGLLPEHRRMLRQGHRHLHDHGRHLHPPLPLLRRRPRPPRAAQRQRAGQPRQDHRRDAPEVRRDHLGGPRRPARRRRPALRRLHPRDARRLAGTPASRCWCRTSAAAWRSRSTSSTPRRPTS
jgi:hypothetical protein